MDDRKIQRLLGALLGHAEQAARDRATELDRIERRFKRLEAALLRALEQLPEALRQHVEGLIYQLRVARYEAHLAGAPSGLPLPPAPAAPSFANIVKEPTRPFMLTHNDETYVKASGVWQALKWTWPVLGPALAFAGAWIWHLVMVAHGGK